jgi:predicted nuclease with TOPRIM domain
MVSRNDEGIMCELCETWFHCECQEISDDIYKVLSHEKTDFFYGRCDREVDKILKSASELHLRQDKLEEKLTKVQEGLNQFRGERLDQHNKMETEFKKVREELQDIKNGVAEGNRTNRLSRDSKAAKGDAGDESCNQAFFQDFQLRGVTE